MQSLDGEQIKDTNCNEPHLQVANNIQFHKFLQLTFSFTKLESATTTDLRRSSSVKLNSQSIAFRYKTRFSENYTTIREIQVLLQCRLLFDLQPSNSSKKMIREIIQPSEKFTIYLISPIRDKVGNCHPFYLHVSELHGAATGFMAVGRCFHWSWRPASMALRRGRQ